MPNSGEQSVKTYYEHRLFMLYGPDEFRRYLGRMLLTVDLWVDQPFEPVDVDRVYDILGWGTALSWQARLEPFGFNRSLNALLDTEGFFQPDFDNVGAPTEQQPFRSEIVFQMLLEYVAAQTVRTENSQGYLSGIVNNAPLPAKQLIDTLYYVSYLQERIFTRGGDALVVSKQSLGRHLRALARNDQGPQISANYPGEPRLSQLYDALWDYLHLLADLKPDKLWAPEVLPVRHPASKALQLACENAADRSDTAHAELVKERGSTTLATGWRSLGKALFDLSEQSLPLLEIEPADDGLTVQFLIDKTGTRIATRQGGDPTQPPRPPEDEAEAQAALPALIATFNAWKAAFETLLGDAVIAEKLAVNAGLLSGSPSIDTIAGLVNRTDQALKQHGIPEPESGQPAFTYRVMRDQIRTYLDVIADQTVVGRTTADRAEIFARGLQGACILASPSHHTTAEARRLEGLKLLVARCGFTTDITRETVSKTLANVGERWSLPDQPVPGDYRGIKQWSAGLVGLIEKAEKRNADRTATPKAIHDAVRGFWSQWSIAPNHFTRLDAHLGLRELDLWHAAQLDNVPVISETAETPSIGQWSRVLDLYLGHASARPVTRNIAQFACKRLGLPDLTQRGRRTDQVAANRSHNPLMMLFVHGIGSPAWQWPSAPKYAAVVVPPIDQQRHDARWGAALDDNTPPIGGASAIQRLLKALDHRVPSAQIQVCVEIKNAEPAETLQTIAREVMPGLPIVAFGNSAPKDGDWRTVANPDSLGDLARLARQAS